MEQKTLGPYRLSEVLGRGGMGTVYRARHRATGEVCAVKALAPTFAEDEHFRNRFESEIKALLKLNHPNIVRLISYGQARGQLFFAMEIVEGKSLFTLQREGHRFDWREVMLIAKDVSQGLRHAHDRGVIHRDLKPGNLLQATTGINKITDFGIAKNFGASQITGTNVVGTMDFMSPEQARGEAVTVRSDLYSLGTVMFTLLTGHPPFASNSVEESVRNLTRLPAPNVRTLVPEVPVEFEQLISKLMSKRPGDRIPTAQALLHRIADVEKTLRNYAEAQTATHSITGDTFDICRPGKDISSSATESFGAKTQPDTPPSPSGNFASAGTIKEEPSENASRIDKTDFFSTVDPDRKPATDSAGQDSPYQKKSFWGLAIGLVAVLAATALGLLWAMQPPDADRLYAEISALKERPERIREKLELFIKHHSDDERIEEIFELRELGEAIALHNRLSVRANLPGAKNRLSEIEKQYLRIIDGVNEAPAQVHTRLKAFVTYYNDLKTVSQRDANCVRAAEAYLEKVRKNLEDEQEFHLKHIKKRMDEAVSMGEDEQRSIYRSITELYGEFDWAAAYVATAKERLKQLAKDQ